MGSDQSVNTKRLPTNLERGKFYTPSEKHTFPSNGRWAESALTFTTATHLLIEEKDDKGAKCAVGPVDPTGPVDGPGEYMTVTLTNTELDALGLEEVSMDGSNIAKERIARMIEGTRYEIIEDLIRSNQELERLFKH